MKIVEVTLTELNLIVPLFHQYRIFYNQYANEDKERTFLKERIANKESVIYMAIEDDQAIGFLQLYPSFSSASLNRLWVLNDLFVLEDYRQRSVASQLIEKAKNLARTTNSRGLMLETGKNNNIAQKLYEKLGFAKSEDYFVYYFSL